MTRRGVFGSLCALLPFTRRGAAVAGDKEIVIHVPSGLEEGRKVRVRIVFDESRLTVGQSINFFGNWDMPAAPVENFHVYALDLEFWRGKAKETESCGER